MKKMAIMCISLAALSLVGCGSNKSDEAKCRDDGDVAACERFMKKTLDDASKELDKASKEFEKASKDLDRQLNNISF